MLQTLLKDQEFLSNIRNVLKNKEILDVLIFGSVSRGKKKPGDIDILLLFKEKENMELGYSLRKHLEKSGLKIQVITRTYTNLFDVKFLPREFILTEAYSMKLKNFISEAFGYKSYTLFNFKINKFSASQRTQFHHGLLGRRGLKGILSRTNGLKLSTLILIPTENSELFVEFLQSWNLDFKKTPVLVPERTIKYGEI